MCCCGSTKTLPLLLEEEKPVRIGFLVNRKSGGRSGAEILQWAKKQGYKTFDLPKCTLGSEPLEGLRTLLLDEKTRTVIFIGGGDGTPSWALSIVEKALLGKEYDGSDTKSIQKLREFYAKKVVFRLLPLGTGNDLAGSLGCGQKKPDIAKLPQIVANSIDREAPYTFVDNWRVEHRTEGGMLSNWITNNMCVYFGTGGAASISKEFHDARETHPEYFNTPFKNHFKYFTIGIQETPVNNLLELYDNSKKRKTTQHNKASQRDHGLQRK